MPWARWCRAQAAALTALCGELRFAHRPITVIARPLEQLADLLDGRGAPDPQWIALAEPPQACLPRIATTRSNRHDCGWRFNQTVIHPNGTVVLRRGVVDTSNRTGLRFIGTPHAELEAAGYRHPFCTTCMQHGLSCSVPDASKIGGGAAWLELLSAIPSLSRCFAGFGEPAGPPCQQPEPQ